MKMFASLALLGAFLPPVTLSCELEDISYSVFNDSSFITFKQTKTIAALSRPLVSTGSIWLSANDDLVWQTLVPLKSTLVISAEGIKQYNKNDDLQSEVNIPAALDLSNILLDILKSDFSALQESFNSSLSCEDDRWLLELQPRDSQISDFLATLSIEGSAFLAGITFQEARGDITEITLSEPEFDSEINFEVYLED